MFLYISLSLFFLSVFLFLDTWILGEGCFFFWLIIEENELVLSDFVFPKFFFFLFLDLGFQILTRRVIRIFCFGVLSYL